MKSTSSPQSTEQQLREMNESLLVSSVHQHELTERAEKSEAALRVSERRTRGALDFAEATLRTSPVPLLVLEEDLRVLLGNEAFYRIFQVDPAGTEGLLVYELGNGQWNIPKLRELLEDILPQQSEFRDFEVAHEFESIGRRTMLLNARQMKNLEGDPPRIVLVIEDISERKQAENDLRQRIAIQAGQTKAKEAALNGAPLETSLGILVETATQQFGHDTRAAFYLADLEGKVLHHVVGMPAEYAKCVDGFPIGPESLSCGLATHTGKPVLTSDVRKEPLWKDWLWMAERFDFRGCWSFPIRTHSGRFIGTLAVYWREPREATERDVELASFLIQTAAIIISQNTEVQERKQAEAALRDSEERLRALVTASSDVIYSMSADWGEMRHLSGREFIVDTLEPSRGWLEEYIHPDDQPRVMEAINQAIGAKSGFELEHRVRRVDGSLGWTFSRAVPILGENGEIIEWFGTASDISHRKQAEVDLRRNAETFATLVEQSPLGIYTVDADFRIRHVSAGSMPAFRNVQPVVGRDFAEVMHTIWPETFASEAVAIFRRVLETGEPYVSPGLTEKRKDVAAIESYEWQVNRVRLADGRFGVVCYFFDVTRLQQANRALAKSEARFRMMADNIAQLAWTCDSTFGNVTWYNRRWLEYTGMSFDDLKGWDWKKVQRPDHIDRVVARVRHSAETGETWEDTFPLRGKDGQYRWFLSRAVPIRDEAGHIACWFGTNTDVTDQREAEAALDAAREAAENANRAKDTFLATLSHEMRTPLSAIVGWMQILQGGPAGGCTEAELNEGLDVVERNARAMVQLMDDVLDVSRIVSGKVRLDVRPCDLSEVIRAGMDVVRSAAQAKDIKLSAELDPAASAVSCDAARMQQVVWNLISNAIKFTPKGGAVRVALDRDQSDLRIQVSDSGQGIGPELLPYVFDRFRQADSSTRRRFGGLGLGLSIVKHLVELHGGTVLVDSEGEGRGSMFTVLLPIRAVHLDESGDGPDAEDFELPSTRGLPHVRLDGLRVLVVDDEADARRLLVKVLGDAGAIVTAAANAEEAVNALQNASPEVLISDLGMPDQDGYDLIRRLRAQGHRAKDLPAVALSAFARKNDRRQALLAGFQMHLAKPADPHDLTAAIASLAGRTGV